MWGVSFDRFAEGRPDPQDQPYTEEHEEEFDSDELEMEDAE